MLFTLLNWLYILTTCYICGYFALSRFTGRTASFSGCVMCGIALLTAYSEYCSLIGGVGIAANIFLVLACLAFAFADRDSHGKSIRAFFSLFEGDTARRALITGAFIISFMIVLVCAYFTAASSFTYDSGTYHAQSIHWIESWGVVRGLAHMQTRLGFNNSYFALCALFSFHFFGQSMHAVSGFLAAFAMVYSVRGYARHLISNRDARSGIVKLRVSDFLYIAPFAYFAITAFEITSPSTDFGVIWMIIWLIIRWVECEEDTKIEGSDDRVTVFSLLSVFSIFLVTVKLSVGVLALITFYPLVFLIREKKYGDIVKYVLSGIILVLPFFIRNYLITGWLVYPFPSLDLFDPDWKVPLEGVKHEADEVVVWARYTKDTALTDQSIREWFPVWWKEQGQANRFLSLSAFTGCMTVAIRILITFLLRVVLRKPYDPEEKKTSYVFMGAVLLICFAFFMTTAPSNRFGYAYILAVPLYGAGDICINLMSRISGGKEGAGRTAARIYGILPAVVICAVLLSGMVRGVRMYAADDKRMVLETGISDYLIGQRDYPKAYCDSEEWEGMNIYYPVNEGEQIWYHAFPAILYRGNLDGMERRGGSIRDGFRLKQVKVDLL